MAEGHEGGDDAPTDHDAADPESGPGAVKDDVAGDFKEEVAQKENAGAHGEDGVGKPGDVMHGQFGEADIDSVDVGQDVAGEKNGNQPEGDLAVDGGGRHGELDED